MNKIDYLNRQFSRLFKPLYIRLALLAIIVSYFYNLPALKYSLEGNNELRLYDIAGFFVLFFVYSNKSIVFFYIRSKPHLKYMHTFILWAGFTLVFTLLFSLFKGRPLWFIRTCLYYYHLNVFFYSAVLIAIYLREKRHYKKIASLILLLIIAEAVLVFLQHSGFVPFLWNEIYRISYGGFLSGALGPNKIVLGMTMFFSFVFSTALFFQKQLKVNRILIIIAMLTSLATIGISGSRTTYLALIVFICYLFITGTKKFFGLSIVVSIAIIIGFFLNLEFIETITTTIENRTINKITDPSLLEDGLTAGQLYDDLGSGRNELSLMYVKYLAANPYIIPIGIGLNNRLLIQLSAHNIYLSLINEVGLVGLYLYFKWLTSYLFLRFGKVQYLKKALAGLVFAMLVTLFFGEHLYIYRSLFALIGYFLLITIMLTVPRYYFTDGNKK